MPPGSCCEHQCGVVPSNIRRDTRAERKEKMYAHVDHLHDPCTRAGRDRDDRRGLTRTIELSEDGTQFTSTGTVEDFDAQNVRVSIGCSTEIATRAP